MLAASDFEVPSRKTTLRGILDFRRRRFTSRRPENQYALSSPCTLSQFLTSGETAGAEAQPRAGEARIPHLVRLLIDYCFDGEESPNPDPQENETYHQRHHTQ